MAKEFKSDFLFGFGGVNTIKKRKSMTGVLKFSVKLLSQQKYQLSDK
jgi:hypothetical protein